MSALDQSPWTLDRSQSFVSDLHPHAGPLEVEVAIVGAGIAGITCALELSRRGKRVALFERARLASGATQSSTAHLTTSLDVSYRSLVGRFGKERARLAAQSSAQAIDYIESTVAELRIDCAFSRLPGFRFTESEEEVERLEREARIAKELGVELYFSTSAPLPFAKAAIMYQRQAQLNPLAYCSALAEAASAQGAMIFVDTTVTEIREGEPCRLQAGGFEVRAGSIVIATNAALEGVVIPKPRLERSITYAIAFAIAPDSLEPALYWDTLDPYHYLRRIPAKSGSPELLLVGGADHPDGETVDRDARFGGLEAWTRDRFKVIEEAHRWSGEIFESVDGLPYIGRLDRSQHIYIATGFAGAGMTWGSAAGRLLADLLTGRENSTCELYNPARTEQLP